MAASAIATMVGLARIAQRRHPAVPSIIALDTDQRTTLMQLTDARAVVQMVFLDPTVPFHQPAAARIIAMGMPLWTKIVQMAACATVPMDGLATVARSLHLVMQNSIALDMEKHMISMRATGARAVALVVSWETTVPFHQLAAARNIAMDMSLWTKTVRMAAIASVNIHGMAMIAP